MRKRRNRNKNVIMERLTSKAETASFDSQFWQKQTSQVRFAALWKAIEESYKLKGKSGHKLRLQRSIQHIERT